MNEERTSAQTENVKKYRADHGAENKRTELTNAIQSSDDRPHQSQERGSALDRAAELIRAREQKSEDS